MFYRIYLKELGRNRWKLYTSRKSLQDALKWKKDMEKYRGNQVMIKKVLQKNIALLRETAGSFEVVNFTELLQKGLTGMVYQGKNFVHSRKQWEQIVRDSYQIKGIRWLK